VLLVLVNDENNLPALQELNRIAFMHEYTLIQAWSNIECARYIETFKAYEGKSAASIQERVENEFLPKVTGILTTVRSVNRTDAVTLLDMFGSLRGISRASQEDLLKGQRIYEAFHEPFMRRPVLAASRTDLEASGATEQIVPVDVNR
jgi:DNA excision repair protein ERCC-1